MLSLRLVTAKSFPRQNDIEGLKLRTYKFRCRLVLVGSVLLQSSFGNQSDFGQPVSQ